MINYSNKIIFNKKELANLFLSVKFNSGNYADKLFSSIKDSTYHIFAYDSKKLVGLISAISDKSINLFITYLLVAPEYQNQGIGKALLNKIIKTGNYNRIELISEENNKSFYEKNGFCSDGIGFFKIDWTR